MIDGKIITQACEIINKTFNEIDKMVDDLKEIFQITQPAMEFSDQYSYGPKKLSVRKWHVIWFNEVSKLKKRKNGRRFFIIFIFCDNDETKALTNNEPELWCGLIKITNLEKEMSPWDFPGILKDNKHFTPSELRVGGFKHRYLYDEKDKYGKWEGDFVGYKLTDISSRDELKALVVDKLF